MVKENSFSSLFRVRAIRLTSGPNHGRLDESNIIVSSCCWVLLARPPSRGNKCRAHWSKGAPASRRGGTKMFPFSDPISPGRRYASVARSVAVDISKWPCWLSSDVRASTRIHGNGSFEFPGAKRSQPFRAFLIRSTSLRRHRAQSGRQWQFDARTVRPTANP